MTHGSQREQLGQLACPVKHFSLFPTALGACGIAWSGDKVVATHLPERSEAETAARFTARMRSAVEDKPPPPMQRIITSIAALLDGEQIDLSFVACEFGSVDAFAAKVYEITRAIPPGETRTYGAIALQLGDKRLAQNVGRALGRNHLPIIVPCHRVIGANGRLTGFSAAGGVETKLRMLAIEGARVGTSPGLFGDLLLMAKLRD